MRKHLTAIGSSLGLIIDKPIAELYKLDRNSELEIIPQKDGFDVRIIRNRQDLSREEKISRAKAHSHEKFGRMFKKLAE